MLVVWSGMVLGLKLVKSFWCATTDSLVHGSRCVSVGYFRGSGVVKWKAYAAQQERSVGVAPGVL